LLALAQAGCSLAAPPSDYFNADGIETIGHGDDLRLLTVAGDYLYYVDGGALYELPAKGASSSATTLGAPHQWAIEKLSSNGHDLVAFCDAQSGGAWVIDHGSPPTQVALGPHSRCVDITVDNSGVVIVSEAAWIVLGVGDSTTKKSKTALTFQRFSPSTGALVTLAEKLRALGQEEQALATRVAMDTSGRLWIVDKTGLQMQRDVSPDAEFCQVVKSTKDVKSLIVVGDDASRQIVTLGWQGRRFLIDDPMACCLMHGCADQKAENNDTKLIKHRNDGDFEHVAVFDGSLGIVQDDQISITPAFEKKAQDVPIAAAEPRARWLTFNAEYAYYVEGNSIQRVARTK
jgi:hypothetical protein